MLDAPLPKSKKRGLGSNVVGYTHIPALKPVVKLVLILGSWTNELVPSNCIEVAYGVVTVAVAGVLLVPPSVTSTLPIPKFMLPAPRIENVSVSPT